MDDILTSRALLESANNPKITFGGQSSSEALNGITENLRADLLALDADVAKVETDLNTNKALLSCQSSAIGTAASRVSTLLAEIKADLVAGNGKVPIDFFDDRYKTASNTAGIDTTFGQATLAITGQSDWLTAKDLEGNTWVPKNSKIRYALRTDANTPADPEFKEDAEFIRALDGDPGSMWVRPLSKVGGIYANQHVWLDIQVPVDVIPSGYANTIILRPFPVFCHDLVSVTVNSPGATPYTISGDGLKFIPGYDSVSKYAKTIADVRIFFPPTQATSVRVHFVTGEFQYWGFSEVALKTTSFASTSTLDLDLTPVKGGSSKSLTSVVLRGANDSALSKLQPAIANNKLTVPLTQQGAGYTPVITLVDAKWS